MFHIHQLPGRLRVRSIALKGNDELASSALSAIPAIAGVTSASINTLTGSILVNYNATLTHAAPIIRELNRLQILSGILGFPKPMPKRPLPAAEKTRLANPSKVPSSAPSTALKSFLGELCLTAGRIFLLGLVEHSASSAARVIVRKIL